jgi:hypothetical protein
MAANGQQRPPNTGTAPMMSLVGGGSSNTASAAAAAAGGGGSGGTPIATTGIPTGAGSAVDLFVVEYLRHRGLTDAAVRLREQIQTPSNANVNNNNNNATGTAAAAAPTAATPVNGSSSSGGGIGNGSIGELASDVWMDSHINVVDAIVRSGYSSREQTPNALPSSYTSCRDAIANAPTAMQVCYILQMVGMASLSMTLANRIG